MSEDGPSVFKTAVPEIVAATHRLGRSTPFAN